MTITGSVAWGHSTGVLEDNIRTFSGNWTGTGAIFGSGDSEEICVEFGEYMGSEVVYTDIKKVELLQNEYDPSGDDVTLRFRHASTAEDCILESFQDYVAPFNSLGFVQAQLINPSWYLAGGISSANCKAAYQPKGAASLAASYVNLANPGINDAAPGVAPDWDATNGWKFNGSDDYLETGIIPASDQTWTMLIRISNLVVGAEQIKYLCGGAGEESWFYIRYYVIGGTPGIVFSHGASIELAVVEEISSGVLGFAGRNVYIDSESQGTMDAGTHAEAIPAIYIGCYNREGSPYYYIAIYCQAFAIYDTILSGDQVVAVSAAMGEL